MPPEGSEQPRETREARDLIFRKPWIGLLLLGVGAAGIVWHLVVFDSGHYILLTASLAFLLISISLAFSHRAITTAAIVLLGLGIATFLTSLISFHTGPISRKLEDLLLPKQHRTEDPAIRDVRDAETKALHARVREMESQLSESKRLLEIRDAELADLQARLSSATQDLARPPPAQSPSSPVSADAPPPVLYHRQIVYFATDRAPVLGHTARFGTFPDEHSMHYGFCIVTIPPVHRHGDLEQPAWYKFELSEDPNKHVTLEKSEEISLGDLRSEINSKLGSTREGRLLLFVHGYNVTFEEAAKRTGQLGWDLDLRGPRSRGLALFYSWPSKGEVEPYFADERMAEWTESDLATFLIDFLSTTTAKDIYIIAHSMGSRPTLRALQDLSTSPQKELLTKVHGVILAAPDIDAATFRRQIAPVFTSQHLAGTLYVSSKDRPLGLSMRVHGGYARLGDPAAGPIVVKGIDTLDASDVDDGDFLGHSYFAGRPAMLEDIYSLMNNGIGPAKRFGLTAVDIEAGRYWRFEGRAR